MNDPAKRIYLAVFNLPNPKLEHKGILDVIRAASGGDFAQAPFKGGMMFAYASDKPPWSLDFGRILMNDDSFVFTEIADQHHSKGFGTLAGWLNRHRPRR